jgi:hypothetical protein
LKFAITNGVALFAGPDGLDVIHQPVPIAARTLAPGGCRSEIGAGRRRGHRLIETTPSLVLTASPDLQSIPRVIVATRRHRGCECLRRHVLPVLQNRRGRDSGVEGVRTTGSLRSTTSILRRARARRRASILRR